MPLVLYNCVTLPLELAFAAESHPAVDWGIDAFFWIDLALNFRTTYAMAFRVGHDSLRIH